MSLTPLVESIGNFPFVARLSNHSVPHQQALRQAQGKRRGMIASRFQLSRPNPSLRRNANSAI